MTHGESGPKVVGIHDRQSRRAAATVVTALVKSRILIAIPGSARDDLTRVTNMNSNCRRRLSHRLNRFGRIVLEEQTPVYDEDIIAHGLAELNSMDEIPSTYGFVKEATFDRAVVAAPDHVKIGGEVFGALQGFCSYGDIAKPGIVIAAIAANAISPDEGLVLDDLGLGDFLRPAIARGALTLVDF